MAVWMAAVICLSFSFSGSAISRIISSMYFSSLIKSPSSSWNNSLSTNELLFIAGSSPVHAYDPGRSFGSIDLLPSSSRPLDIRFCRILSSISVAARPPTVTAVPAPATLRCTRLSFVAATAPGLTLAEEDRPPDACLAATRSSMLLTAIAPTAALLAEAAALCCFFEIRSSFFSGKAPTRGALATPAAAPAAKASAPIVGLEDDRNDASLCCL
mmetsp:Transcript_6886/g.10448  ORF Transcript_6886/g.10448 Transcript_6886/m.10448 type:complete len:214 (+) Transcript_6886:725-1366(+)